MFILEVLCSSNLKIEESNRRACSRYKTLPELVQNIIKSNSVTASKLFADAAAYDSKAGVFISLADNGILPCIKIRKRMLKLDGKKGTSLVRIYMFWHKEMIYKSGRI